MFDWKLRLSKRVDIWIVVICWAITIMDTVGAFVVYSTASSYDLYLPDQSAIEKALRAFLYLASFSIAAMILVVGDRRIANKNIRSQEPLSSDFTPPELNFKKLNIARVIMTIVILFFSLPWILALFGVFISDVPVLNLIFLGRQPYGSKLLPSVHLGTHHGTWAYQFGIIAILFTKFLDSKYYLKDVRARSIIAGGIVFLAGYAVINGLEDGFNEQVMKRGIDLIAYDVVGAIYSSPLFYPILAGIALFVIMLWYKFARKKERELI